MTLETRHFNLSNFPRSYYMHPTGRPIAGSILYFISIASWPSSCASTTSPRRRHLSPRRFQSSPLPWVALSSLGEFWFIGLSQDVRRYRHRCHEEGIMTAFNVVRFKVKPGMDEAFLDAHRNIAGSWSGMRHANIIKTRRGTLPHHRGMGEHGGAGRRTPGDDRHARQLPPDT